MPNLEREIECDVHGIEHSCVLPNHTVSQCGSMDGRATAAIQLSIAYYPLPRLPHLRFPSLSVCELKPSFLWPLPVEQLVLYEARRWTRIKCISSRRKVGLEFKQA